MTLDERIAKLEERTNYIVQHVQRIESKIDVLDSKIESLQMNSAYLKGKMSNKHVAGVSALIIAFWEIIRRIFGI